jgi:hypothetical protein
MQKSVKELILKRGSFTSNEYVHPKTGEPPPTAVGPPDPSLYQPGIRFIIAGLILQIVALFL